MVFRYYRFGRSNIRYIFTLLGCFTTLALLVLTLLGCFTTLALLVLTLLGCFTTLALLVLTPDSMDVLAQRWFMVGRLADGWRWFCNVGPT